MHQYNASLILKRSCQWSILSTFNVDPSPNLGVQRTSLNLYNLCGVLCYSNGNDLPHLRALNLIVRVLLVVT